MRAAALLAALLVGCSDSMADSPDAAISPDAAPLPCEPVDGTGCPAGQKCTLLATGDPRQPLRVGCDDLHGSLGAFATDCRPQPDLLDRCGPGLWCFAGREPDGLFCRPLCHADRDCPSQTDRCLWFTGLEGPPPTGMCAFECTLFGNDCPGTSRCSRITWDTDMVTWWMGCAQPGPTAVGSPCIDVYECAAEAYCWDRTCRALCDASHGCAAGTTCQPIPGLPANGGICR